MKPTTLRYYVELAVSRLDTPAATGEVVELAEALRAVAAFAAPLVEAAEGVSRTFEQYTGRGASTLEELDRALRPDLVLGPGERATERRVGENCPACGRWMPSFAVDCIECGYDRAEPISLLSAGAVLNFLEEQGSNKMVERRMASLERQKARKAAQRAKRQKEQGA